MSTTVFLKRIKRTKPALPVPGAFMVQIFIVSDSRMAPSSEDSKVLKTCHGKHIVTICMFDHRMVLSDSSLCLSSSSCGRQCHRLPGEINYPLIPNINPARHQR